MTHEEKSIWLLVLGGQIDLALTIGEGLACNAWKTLRDWELALSKSGYRQSPEIAKYLTRDFYITCNYRTYTPIDARRIDAAYMETDGVFPENLVFDGKKEKGVITRYFCNKQDEDDFIIVFAFHQTKYRKHLSCSTKFIKRIGAGLEHWQYNAIARQVERWCCDNCEFECHSYGLPF